MLLRAAGEDEWEMFTIGLKSSDHLRYCLDAPGASLRCKPCSPSSTVWMHFSGMTLAVLPVCSLPVHRKATPPSQKVWPDPQFPVSTPRWSGTQPMCSDGFPSLGPVPGLHEGQTEGEGLGPHSQLHSALTKGVDMRKVPSLCLSGSVWTMEIK